MRLADANCGLHRFMRRTVISTILVGVRRASDPRLPTAPSWRTRCMQYARPLYSGVPVFQPARQKIALQPLEYFRPGRRDAESDIKREYQESDAHAEHGLPIASGNAALLRLRLYREVTNRYDRRYDQRGASKSPQVVRRENLGATQLVSPCIIHICFSLTLSSLRKKCRMLIKLLAQGALKINGNGVH